MTDRFVGAERNNVVIAVVAAEKSDESGLRFVRQVVKTELEFFIMFHNIIIPPVNFYKA